MRKLLTLFFALSGIAGYVILQIVRWPAIKSFSHAWATGEPAQRVMLSGSLFLSGFALMLLASIGLWLEMRRQDKENSSPPSSRPGLRLVS